jgi:hypothetical protein
VLQIADAAAGNAVETWQTTMSRRDIRLLFLYAEESRYVSPVERVTGHKVKAFISRIDTNADVACEMFVLHPETPSLESS